jgi:hypothetical protein
VETLSILELRMSNLPLLNSNWKNGNILTNGTLKKTSTS